MSSLGNNFKIDPNNYLSNDYSAYISKLTELSLVSPKSYLALRNQLKQKLFRNAITIIYNTTFSALTEGKDYNGASLFANIAGVDVSQYKVEYPNQLATEISASYAKQMQSQMEKLLDIICPDLLNGVLSEQLKKTSHQDLL